MCIVTNKPLPRKAITASKKTTANKASRRVRFGQAQQKVFHQPLSQSDKRTIWYNGTDYKNMNRQVRRSLQKELYFGFDPNDEERTWRGLEHIREGVPNVKLQRRRSFVRGLLYFHKTMGVTDPEELSAIACTQSNVDQVRAQQFADYDAYEAQCVHYPYEPLPWRQEDCAQTPEPDADALADYEVFRNIPRSKCVVSPEPTVLMARTVRAVSPS